MSVRRATRVRIDAVLQRAAEPIFVLGPERQVMYCNAACEQLTGYPAEQLLGLRCQYGGAPESGDLPGVGSSLAPPPEAYEGVAAAVETLFVRPDGERVWRRIVFLPCHDESGRLMGVMGLVSQQAKALAGTPDPPHVELHEELARLRDRLYRRYGFDRIVAASPAMRRVLDQVRVASQTDGNVLIWGEAGTGKELVARTIHYQSTRRAAPFVPVDCGLIAPDLLERDLFGAGAEAEHRSSRQRPALVRAAANGTLFLRNLSRLTRDLQSRLAELLRRTADGHETGAGGERRTLRVIAADRLDPSESLRNETLRPDLYFALSTLVIYLPPLRERNEDFELLAQVCVESINAAAQKQLSGISPQALEVLRAYDWPGNVRELDSVIRQAHERSQSTLIEPADLTPQIKGALGAAQAPPPIDAKIDLAAILIKTERKLIETALQKSRGNKSRAADLLSISRPRLYRRMQMLGIDEAAAGQSPPTENAE